MKTQNPLLFLIIQFIWTKKHNSIACTPVLISSCVLEQGAGQCCLLSIFWGFIFFSWAPKVASQPTFFLKTVWAKLRMMVGLGHFPGGSAVKSSPPSEGEAGSIFGSGRSPREENSSLLQYSCLENPTDRGVWWITAHGVTKESDTT